MKAMKNKQMFTETLQAEWLALGRKYSGDEDLLRSVWEKIEKNHTDKARFYHNLEHIAVMFKQAKSCAAEIDDLDAVLFAIWFHDIIYKSTRKDNEEKSAEFAFNTLSKLSLERRRIEKVTTLIHSTKKHQVVLSENRDNAYLLDFDLSILGQSWEVYKIYIDQIRKEYRIYPDLLYKPGRKKVLKSFLEREQLYFTEKYRVLYEEQARKNLEKEILDL